MDIHSLALDALLAMSIKLKVCSCWRVLDPFWCLTAVLVDLGDSFRLKKWSAPILFPEQMPHMLKSSPDAQETGSWHRIPNFTNWLFMKHSAGGAPFVPHCLFISCVYADRQVMFHKLPHKLIDQIRAVSQEILVSLFEVILRKTPKRGAYFFRHLRGQYFLHMRPTLQQLLGHRSFIFSLHSSKRTGSIRIRASTSFWNSLFENAAPPHYRFSQYTNIFHKIMFYSHMKNTRRFFLLAGRVNTIL